MHVLFGGTKLLQSTGDKGAKIKTPDGGCLAVVLRTGFGTAQGERPLPAAACLPACQCKLLLFAAVCCCLLPHNCRLPCSCAHCMSSPTRAAVPRPKLNCLVYRRPPDVHHPVLHRASHRSNLEAFLFTLSLTCNALSMPCTAL